MTGRGRGRGTLARWSTNTTLGKPLTTEARAIASVQPLKSEPVESDPELTQPPDDESQLEEYNEFDIRVTHVIDVEHFWAQLGLAGELEKFDLYLGALRQWCDKQPAWTGSCNVATVVIGQVVCVKCVSTGFWERGQITRITESMVDVFYLDSGTVESLNFDNLCSNTPADITSYAPQAQYCTLAGVQPFEGSWSEEANARFKELVSPVGQKHVAHQLSNNYKLTVYLRDSRGSKISVSSILIKEGFAKHYEDTLVDQPEHMYYLNYFIKNFESAHITSEEPTGLPWVLKQQTSGPQQSRRHPSEERFYLRENQSDVNSRIEFKTYSNPSESSYPAVSQYNQQLFNSQLGLPQMTGTPALNMRWSENTENIVEDNNLGFRRRDASPIVCSTSSSGVRPPPGFAMNMKPQDFQAKGRAPHQDRHIGRGPNVTDPYSLRYDVRPHLSGPTEFTLHEKMPGFQSVTPSEADMQQPGSSWKAAGKYIPPALRNRQTKEEENFRGMSQHNASLQFQGPTTTSSHLNQHVQSWQQTTLKSQSNYQPSSVPQPAVENNREKVLKAELDWQKFKVQRKVNQVFSKLKLDNMAEHMPQLKKIASENKLSSSFNSLSEIMILLQLITERVVDEDSFVAVALQVCLELYGFRSDDFVHHRTNNHTPNKRNFLFNYENFHLPALCVCIIRLITGNDIPDFCDSLDRVMNDFRDELSTKLQKLWKLEQCRVAMSYTISNCEKKCRRFCVFMGQLFTLALEHYQSSFSPVCWILYDVTSSCKRPIDKKSFQHSFYAALYQMTAHHTVEDERQSQMQAFCLCEIFTIIGPGWEVTDRDTLNSYFTRIRELVLSSSLDKETKSRLLDLLLLRASGWTRSADFSKTVEEEDASNINEVLVERDEDEEEEEEENQSLITGDVDGKWDPYFRVKRMLQSLRLESLLEKFQDNCIRDSLLDVESVELRNTLKDAAFPPGVILEMKMYLEKEAEAKQDESSDSTGPRKAGKTGSEKVNQKPRTVKPSQQSESREQQQRSDTKSVSDKGMSSVGQVSESGRKPLPSDEKPSTAANSRETVNQFNQKLQQIMTDQKSPGVVETSQRPPHPQGDKLVSTSKTTTPGPSPYSVGTGQFSSESKSLQRQSSLEDTRSKPPHLSFSFPPPPDIDGGMPARVSPDFNPTAPYPLPCTSGSTAGSTPSYSEVLKLVSPSEKSPSVQQTWALPSEQKPVSHDQKSLPLVKGLVPPRPGKGIQPAAEKKDISKKGIMKTPPGVADISQQIPGKTADVSNPKQNAQFKGVRFSSRIESSQSPSDAPNWRETPTEAETFTAGRFSHEHEVGSRTLPVQQFEKMREGSWDMERPHGDRFSASPAEVSKPTPFGLKGPKACTLCGSTSHRESNCTDRSNWFID